MKLKKLLSDAFKYIITLFKNAPDKLKEAVHIGVVITENIKEFVDSPVADIITMIIPGNIDDNIKNWLRLKLPIILIQLKLADNYQDKNEIVRSGIRTLNSLNGNLKNIFLHNLAILLAQAASNDELNWHDSVYISEWYYQKKYKPYKLKYKDQIVNNSL